MNPRGLGEGVIEMHKGFNTCNANQMCYNFCKISAVQKISPRYCLFLDDNVCFLRNFPVRRARQNVLQRSSLPRLSLALFLGSLNDHFDRMPLLNPPRFEVTVNLNYNPTQKLPHPAHGISQGSVNCTREHYIDHFLHCV